MSLYSQYIVELAGKQIVEDENGFATYFFTQDYCYIEDIFVVKEKRKMGIAANYADKIATIALENGKTKLLGTVRPTANGSTESLKILLSYGFKLYKSEVDFIYFTKEIGD